jgi:hypothetical protein
MNKKLLTIVKLNIRNNGWTYIITGIFIALFLIQDIRNIVNVNNERFVGGMNDNGYFSRVGMGSVLYLLVIFSAASVSANFRKLINLRGRRDGFFKSALLTYIIIAFFVSLANMVVYYTYDLFMEKIERVKILNLAEASGWLAHGLPVAVLQQFVFLLFVAVVIHTLGLTHGLLRGSWRGWLFDGVLLAFIVALLALMRYLSSYSLPLRWFFRYIIFQPNVFLQIPLCLALAGIMYGLSFLLVYRKEI